MMRKGFKQLVAEANSRIRTWTVAEAVAALGDDGVAFVDIREADEIAREGMIPGAETAPRGLLEFHADPESANHKPVFASGKTLVLYCASAGRSALAAQTLQDMGIDTVAHIAGGFKAWVAAGGPVEKKGA